MRARDIAAGAVSGAVGLAVAIAAVKLIVDYGMWSSRLTDPMDDADLAGFKKAHAILTAKNTKDAEAEIRNLPNGDDMIATCFRYKPQEKSVVLSDNAQIWTEPPVLDKDGALACLDWNSWTMATKYRDAGSAKQWQYVTNSVVGLLDVIMIAGLIDAYRTRRRFVPAASKLTPG